MGRGGFDMRYAPPILILYVAHTSNDSVDVIDCSKTSIQIRFPNLWRRRVLVSTKRTLFSHLKTRREYGRRLRPRKGLGLHKIKLAVGPTDSPSTLEEQSPSCQRPKRTAKTGNRLNRGRG